MMEMKILKALNWKLHYPTAGEIARTLILIFELPKEIDTEIFFKHVDNYIEFCLLGSNYYIKSLADCLWWIEYELSIFGLTTIALTSILCSFENAGMFGFGEQLVISVCQYFNLNTVLSIKFNCQKINNFNDRSG